MKKIFKLLLVVLMVLSFFGCKEPEVIIEGPLDENFQKIIDEWFVEDMSEDYLSLHFGVVNPKELGIENVEVTLGEIEIEDDYDGYLKRLKVLNDYDITNLNREQLITYKALLAYYNRQQSYLECEYDYGFVFTPNRGVNNNLITNFTEFEVRSEQDAKDLITLVLDSERYINLCIEYTKEQAKEGVIQNDAVIDKIIDSCERFISRVEDNEVIKAYNASIEKLKLANEEELKQQLADAVINVLIPAYQKIIDLYQSLYGKCSNPDGLFYYEGGTKYYEVIFLGGVSSNTKTVDEWAETLRNTIINTVSSIVTVSENMSFSDYNKWSKGKNHYGYEDPYEMIEHVKSNMSNDFPAIPEVEYSVNYLDPSVTSENISAYYLIAPLDKLTNNVIKVNEAFSKNSPDEMAITLAHEAYPGHLYQHTYYFTHHPSQKIRYNIGFIGYSEGWAMYSEEYGYKYYEKSKDIREIEILYLKFNYYLQAYCDILINYYGYEVDDLGKYLSNFFNEDYAYSLAENIYDTLIGDPSMFTPYALGYYQMTKLYDDTQKHLRKKFNVKEFNTLILDTGDVDFDTLTWIVNEYIALKK
ncbi:MAG: DUF885 family protein [Erysipelotrichaceae bacterium]|jgi:uncharacterized protein (DUF885 family)